MRTQWRKQDAEIQATETATFWAPSWMRRREFHVSEAVSQVETVPGYPLLSRPHSFISNLPDAISRGFLFYKEPGCWADKAGGNLQSPLSPSSSSDKCFVRPVWCFGLHNVPQQSWGAGVMGKISALLYNPRTKWCTQGSLKTSSHKSTKFRNLSVYLPVLQRIFPGVSV